MIENEEDDPRRNDPPFLRFGGDDDDIPTGGMPGGSLFDLFSTVFRPPLPDESLQDRTGTRVSRNGMFMGGPDGMRAVPLGGGGDVGGGEGNGTRVRMMLPRLSELLGTPSGEHPFGTTNDGNNEGRRRGAVPPLLVTYLLSSLLSSHGNAPNFQEFLSGRAGDYVMDNEALQTLMTELMNAGGPQRNLQRQKT
ncbi:hypothetical protein M422DRAFT_29189 [Sphaerobolus stellatus SS14]|uniref:Uncharacterized protein n=1 Tax=Sphaerobolus stellatus (strain SS14) TaxID=990650 RepID=A0A0C9VUP7_SPHS4|nr:hypothetical protein M422DRAFT_29189 [Sphaerobolus stellatus SS14]